MRENRNFVVPVNILTPLRAPRFLGPHDTLPCVLITYTMATWDSPDIYIYICPRPQARAYISGKSSWPWYNYFIYFVCAICSDFGFERVNIDSPCTPVRGYNPGAVPSNCSEGHTYTVSSG